MIKRSAYLLLPVIAAAALAGCFESKPPERVSIIKLIADPERYDGQSVKAKGFVHLDTESFELFLTKDDCLMYNRANSVWLSYESAEAKKMIPTICRFVEIKGRFSKKGRPIAAAIADINGGFAMVDAIFDAQALSEEKQRREKVLSGLLEKENAEATSEQSKSIDKAREKVK